MKCPRCQHDFRLNLQGYLRSPLGRHSCPACGIRFKLLLSFSYIAVLFLAWLIGAGVPAVLVYHFSGSILFGALTYLVCGVLFVLPLDLWMDNRWRQPKEM